MFAAFLLGGCAGPATPWEDVIVLDERADREAVAAPFYEYATLADWARQHVQWFGASAAASHVHLGEVALVDEISSNPHVVNAEEGQQFAAAGVYNWNRRRVEIVPRGDFSGHLDHELCHVLDRETEISGSNEDWLTIDAVPEDLREDVFFERGTENEEVFAALCAAFPPSWIDRWLEDACGMDRIDDSIRRIQDQAFPADIPPILPSIDLEITPIDAGLSLSGRIRGAQPIGGVLHAYVSSNEGDIPRHSIGVLGRDGFVELAVLPREGRLTRLLPSDGPIVVLGAVERKTLRLVGADWVEVLLPEGNWDEGVVDQGVLLAVDFIIDDPHVSMEPRVNLIAVDFETGRTEQVNPPTNNFFSLASRDGDPVALATGEAWLFQDGGWTPIFQLAERRNVGRDRVSLADGREIVKWYAYNPDHTVVGGFGVHLRDDTFALGSEACASGERPEGELVTDGRSVWNVRYRDFDWIAVPPE